jgi:predicted acetyltransferase
MTPKESIELRSIGPDEFRSYVDAMWAGFGRPGITDEVVELRRPFMTHWDRVLACFDDRTAVATARSYPTGLTVPGGSVIAAAVTNVSVVPTHRRRGLMTRLMRHQLDQVADAGEPVAILIASESGIYGRFGYGPASVNAEVELDPTRCTFAASPPPGSVRLAGREEARKALPEIYARFQEGQPGAIDRIDRHWDIQLRFITGLMPGDTEERFCVLHRDPEGEPDAYALYRIEEKWERRLPASTLWVDDCTAATAEGYHAVWRHLLDVDLVQTVRAYERPRREPLPWLLTDPRQVTTVSTSDFLWVRIVDPVAALEARRYAAEGKLVLELTDDVRPDTAGRFVVEGDPDGAVCAFTDASPDLTLPIQVLGASYLGEPAFADAAVAGAVVEHTPGAVARAEAMFGWTPRPWCHTWF